MSESDREVLFVQGIQKTGTSTLVGILNCHPNIFLLYESGLANSAISRYANQILERYPDARQFFRQESDIAVPYREFFQFLEGKHPEIRYRYCGDKLINLDPDVTQKIHPHRVIFALRDIRTWLCKEQIVKYYRTDLDVVPVAIDYLKYVIGSFRHSHGHRVWLEDLVERNEMAIDGLSDYLKIDLKPFAETWWQKIGDYDALDPKSMIQWYSVHPSSKVAPEKLDTTCELKSHPFWNELLEIVGPYNRQERTDRGVDSIRRDVLQLENLRRFSPLPLNQCYDLISTSRFGRSAAVPTGPGDSIPATMPKSRNLFKWLGKRVGIRSF